jgi:hypothetical protein
MKQEIKLVKKNWTWVLKDLLPSKVPITCKGVQKVEKSITKQPKRLKT